MIRPDGPCPFGLHQILLFLFPEPKARQRKFPIILSKTPKENYTANKVVQRNTSIGHNHCIMSFPPFSFSLETCLNSFQNSIPFPTRRNKSNENVDMLQTIQSAKLILNSSLKRFRNTVNLTSLAFKIQYKFYLSTLRLGAHGSRSERGHDWTKFIPVWPSYLFYISPALVTLRTHVHSHVSRRSRCG